MKRKLQIMVLMLLGIVLSINQVWGATYTWSFPFSSAITNADISDNATSGATMGAYTSRNALNAGSWTNVSKGSYFSLNSHFLIKVPITSATTSFDLNASLFAWKSGKYAAKNCTIKYYSSKLATETQICTGATTASGCYVVSESVTIDSKYATDGTLYIKITMDAGNDGFEELSVTTNGGSSKTSVTLHPNGGIITADDWTPSNGNYTKESATGSFPEITHVGYNNVEWCKEANLATSISSMPDPAVTADYYAKWTNPKQFSIIYKDKDNADFTGTHGENHPENHTYGTATALVEPTKTGYHFDGWFTTSACTGTAVTSLAATTYTDNITLYAKWTAERTVHFFVDGTEDEGKKIIVLDGSALGTLPTATSSDPEYTEFIGWTEAAEITAATTTCPTLISATTTISEDKNYRAVFAKAENFSFAAADNSTYSTSSLTFTDNTTGVKLTISNGQRYTSNTPYTFSVSYGNNYYFQISHTTKLISSLQVTLSEAKYSIRSVDNGKLTTSSTTQTVSDINKTSVKCYAQTSSNQIRATVISGKALVSFLTKFSNDPQISVSTEELSGFEAIATAGAGAAKSFKVSGVKLQDNISVSVTGNYEICQTVEGEYTNSLTLTKGGDNKVAETTIFVRLKAHAEAAATVNGSISVTSTNAEPKSVTLAGTVAAKVLNSIAIKTAPTKTTYILGETFDPAGLVITAKYNSGDESVSYADHEEDFTFSPDLSTEITGSTANVQITWGGQSVNQSISKKCSVAWYVNGSELTGDATTVGYNTKVTALPNAPTTNDCDGSKVFVGWTAEAIDGETDTKPTDLFTEASGAQTLTANTTYYAVFANAAVAGIASHKTDSWECGASAPVGWSGGTSYYSTWSGFKGANTSIQNKAITDFQDYAGVASDIEIKVTSFQNATSTGSTTLTIYLIDKNGDVVTGVAGQTITPVTTNNNPSGATEQSVHFGANASATGFMIKCTSYDKNTLVSKMAYDITYNATNYSAYATTCCTKWTAPTLTYSYDAIHVNDHVSATLGEGTTHGEVRFESSDEEVLTVAADGQITAVGAGHATITAYWENDAEGYCNNSVTSNEVVVTNSFNIIYKDKGDADFTGTHGDAYPTTHTYGTATTLVEPTKDYYDFEGWFIASDCSGEALTELAAHAYTEDITLYAKWTAKEYAITYNNVDGATHSNPENFTVESDEIVLADASKTGHAFLGWYDAETDGNKVTSIVPAETHDAVALWAKWTVNSYAIDWSLGGGWVSASSPAYTVAGLIDYNTAITAPVVEREGYRFAGWKCNDAAVDFSAEVLMPAAPATYVAQWVKVWKVDFQNNGESLDGYPKEFDVNATLGELPSGDELESCHTTSTTFMGWSTAEMIVPGGKPADNTFATAETTVTDNLVYNAVWAKATIGNEVTSVNYTGGSGLTDMTYVSGKGVSSYTNQQKYYTKLDNTGDYILLSLPGVPTSISLETKMIGGNNTSSIEIQECVTASTKETDWTTIETMTISGSQNDEVSYTSNGTYHEKYIKLLFNKGANVGLGGLVVKTKSISYSNYITKCTTATIYNIAADAPITGGSVAIVGNKTNALENDEIEVVANPDEGWQFKSWKILDTETADEVATVDENNKFMMPATDVTVSATFEKIPVSSISLSFTSIDVEKNETPELPTVSYLPTTILESQKGVEWTSEDATIAEAYEGHVMAYKVGQTTLTATSNTNHSVTATLAVNVYGWNLATTDAYVVTPGTLDNLTDAKSFTASEWGVKANYVRSDNAELTKQETVSTWKAFIGENEIANGYTYQLSDNNKTLYIKVGDVVAASYELTITAVKKDKYVDLVHDTYKVSEEINYIYMAGDGYTIPTIANTAEPSEYATNCTETHYVFKGWVAEADKDVPTNPISATGTNDADGTTYYAVWAEKKNVTEQKSAKIESFSGASGATNGAKGKFDDNVKYETAQGSGTSAPGVYSEALRMYQPSGSNTVGSSLTISAQNGYSISKITITMTGAASFDYYLNSSSTAAGSLSTTSSSLTQSIENLSCSSVLFKHTTKANTNIKSMSVEYEKTVLTDVDYITECVDRYELSFNNNGGTGESFQSVMLKEGAEYILPAPSTLSKDKCDFIGWYELNGETKTHYIAGDSYIMGESATTLYAEWAPWTLEGISLTLKNVKTTFDEDEMYSNENLSVTAHYTNIEDVEKTEQVIGWTTDHDSYKTVAFGHDYTGTKTVTVSYVENEVEKTATYDITIRQYTNLYFYVNGSLWQEVVTKSGKIAFPAIPSADAMGDLNYFVGWSKCEVNSIAKPALVSGDANVEEGDVFYAVFGKTTGETVDKSITITRTSIPLNNWASYAWVNWAQDGVAGEVDAYHQTGNIQMNNGNGSKTGALFSTTPLPGYIKSIKMTKATTGADRNWTVYGNNTAFGETATGGTQIGVAQSVTTEGATWTVSAGDYRYFMCKVTGGSTNIASIEVTYADPLISVYSTKSIEKYTRENISGTFGTICLPKAVEAGMYEGATFFEGDYLLMQGGMPYKYYLSEVDHLEAGYPYVFVMNEGSTSITLYQTGDADVAHDRKGLVGTLDIILDYAAGDARNTLEGNYFIYDNEFRLCGAWCGLNANRAYLDINKTDVELKYQEEPQQVGGRKRIALTNRAAQTPTGFDGMIEGGINGTDVRKVMIEDHIYVIRAGKMYDLNGRLVK